MRDPVVEEDEAQQEEDAPPGPAAWITCPRIASSRAQGRALKRAAEEAILISSDDE